LTDGLSGHVRRPRKPPIRDRVQRPADDVAILRHQALKVLGQVRRTHLKPNEKSRRRTHPRSVVDNRQQDERSDTASHRCWTWLRDGRRAVPLLLRPAAAHRGRGVLRRRLGRVSPSRRRLAACGPHAHHLGARRAADGARPAPARRRRRLGAPLRPRLSTPIFDYAQMLAGERGQGPGRRRCFQRSEEAREVGRCAAHAGISAS
jgi:hypothetical protein